jgi:uncharacterized repeat protein (TIGR01451 family)
MYMKSFTAFAAFWLFAALLPAQSAAQWTHTNGPAGGYVFQMRQHNNTIFACTDGGLWASTDAGQSWHVFSDAFAGKRVLAITPGDSEFMVLAVEFLSRSTEISYLYRSTDGGQTWSAHNLTETDPYIRLDISSRYLRVWRDGNRLWLNNSYSYYYYSNDNGATWAELPEPPNEYLNQVAIHGDNILAYNYYNRFRSDDLGLTWAATPDTAYSRDILSNGDFILMLNNDTLYTSNDFGQTWYGGVPATNSNMYELNGVAQNEDGTFRYVRSHYYHSSDGLNWQNLTPSLPLTYAVEGVQVGNEFVLSGSSGIYKTSQNGTQVAKSEQGFRASRISALEALSNGRIVAATTYSGTWSSINGGLSWEKIPAPSSDFANEPTFIILTAKGDTLFGLASTDTVYQLVGNSMAWTKITTADAWYAGESFFRIFGNDIYLIENEQVRRNKDGGATWQPFLPTVSVSNGYRDIAALDNFLFYTTNSGELYRSQDDGATWTLMQEFWSPGAHRYNKLSTVGGRLTYWSEYESYYSTNYGNTWKALEMVGLPADSWGDVYFDPLDLLVYQNLFITANPYHGVYISFDLGNSWEPLNEGLPHLRTRELAISGPSIYLGTSVDGVWRLNADFEVFGGKIYNDLNNNGQPDAGEPPLKSVLVGAEPLGSYASSGVDGIYYLVAANQLDTLRATPPNKYSTIKPAYRLANQPGSTYDFGVHFTPGIIDLKLDITNWQPFRPGFSNTITLTAQNIGNEPVPPCTVTFVVPAGLTINGYTPFGEATLDNDTLRWNLPALALAEIRSLEIELTLSAAVPIDEVLLFSAHAAVANDSDPVNNYASLRTIVVGSYDPNDKAAVERITPEEVAAGMPLEYVIRFENTGNFYAEKVVVKDVLEKNLNPATFQFISSSHPCTWRMAQEGSLEFTFSNIFLLPGATGFVKFSVEADRDLMLHESVSNTAAIYFDFNAPIITNTVKTAVEYSLSSTSPAQSLALHVSPNPGAGLVWLKFPASFSLNSLLLEVFDQQGKRLSTLVVNGDHNSVDLSFLPAGSYLLMATDTQSGLKAGEKVVVVR